MAGLSFNPQSMLLSCAAVVAGSGTTLPSLFSAGNVCQAVHPALLVPPPAMQEVSMQLQRQHNCYPVFLGAELKANYYKSE